MTMTENIVFFTMLCAICTIIICCMVLYVIQFLGDIEKKQKSLERSIDSIQSSIRMSYYSTLDVGLNQEKILGDIDRARNDILLLGNSIFDLKERINSLPNNFTEEEMEIITGFAELLKKQKDETN